eukprot:SAG11_NODE_15502_length_576_cov_0.740042_1_plen_49_part_01
MRHPMNCRCCVHIPYWGHAGYPFGSILGGAPDAQGRDRTVICSQLDPSP